MSYTYFVDDLYTASGTALPFGCWTDSVTKFSAASFYNYEQDNLPLFDLEERTEFLWYKFGYPTSSIPGMVLLVSADAPAESVVCQGNIFHDLSSAINILPRHLNFPVIIEVASFGDLGSLDISDIQMGPNGSLEIINRLTLDKPVSLSGSYDGIATNFATFGPHAPYGNIFKDIKTATGNDTNNLFGFFTKVKGYTPSSLLGIPIFSGTGPASMADTGTYTLDTRTLGSYVGFYGTPAGQERISAASNYQFTRLSVAELTLPASVNMSTQPFFTITAALQEEAGGVEIHDYDPSSFTQYNPTLAFANELYRKTTLNSSDDDKPVKGTYYGNYLRSINITSCQGPLYVRGFYCSGDGLTTETGVSVIGANVNFENLAVSRFTKYGVHLEDSTVNLLGSFYAYRCYGRDDNQLRLSKDWETINSKLFEAPRDDSAAINSVNSTLVFADSTDFYEAYIASKSPDLDDAERNQGINSLRVIARCSTGIRLINSTLSGGRPKDLSSITSPTSTRRMDFISIEGNANYGLEMINSNLSYSGRLEVFGNTRGLSAKNSSLVINECSFDYNHIYGIHLNNSEFTYGGFDVSSANKFDYGSLDLTLDPTKMKQFAYTFIGNGQHINAVNSKILIPEYTKDTPAYFGRMFMNEAHGANGLTASLPAVELKNSIAKFIHLTARRSGQVDTIALGSHILAKDNSEAYILGSASSVCSFLVGAASPTYNAINYTAALAAENNSTIRFRGPVMIWDAAVGAYANKNSNLIFEPHKLSDEALDYVGYDLLNTPKSHTMIEIKSYKSCLVADKNSNIVMENLGDYASQWALANYTNTNYDTLDLGYRGLTDHGYMQFYPNPNYEGFYGTNDGITVRATRPNSCRLQSSTRANSYYWSRDPFTADEYHLSALTQGGLCVKALNGSHVRVKNVHFPCGYWNPSSVIYDYGAADTYCSRLFIWNLSNNSTMNVDHVSVSGVYPSQAGYHGPYAVWLSGANAASYAAPSSTPDTSTLSVLDYYGSGIDNSWNLPDGSTIRYGQSGFFNQGPFRIYVGVDSLANHLFINNGDPGYVTQVFAQGYNMGEELSSTPTLSGLYGKVLRVSEENGLESSGWYYCNEFVSPNPNLIMLDESAANTFANAKNGAMGTSNRPQICVIYESNTTGTGEGRAGTGFAGDGTGFKSPNIFDLLEEC